MFKSFCLLACTLFTVLSWGQNVIFEPNVNYDARELKQNLNKNRDSLILESETIISQVDILNNNFLKTIDFNKNRAKIDITALPVGNYIIQARLGKKRIVMYLEKGDPINPFDDILPSISEEEERAERGPSLMELLNKKSVEKKVLYWVVSESKGSFGSSKTMSLEYEDKVFNLINKNKLELKSKVAKKNTLIVYEVYNLSKFMARQYRNRNYYESKNSEFFNVTPLYSSETEIQN